MSNKLNQKAEPSFQDFRQIHYESLSDNYAKLFNFFYENNDIFRFIDKEDEQELQQAHVKYLNTTFNWTLGTFGSVLFMDQIFFRYVYPIQKRPNFRFIRFVSKYVALPLIGFKVATEYFSQETDEKFRTMAEKYSFNYQDYQRAMDIFERAQKVGRLEELMDKGGEFDWTGVPKFQSNISKQFQDNQSQI